MIVVRGAVGLDRAGGGPDPDVSSRGLGIRLGLAPGLNTCTDQDVAPLLALDANPAILAAIDGNGATRGDGHFAKLVDRNPLVRRPVVIVAKATAFGDCFGYCLALGRFLAKDGN